MSDILSAASLLLAILTTLFGFYYPEIKGILDAHVDTSTKTNNRQTYDKAKIVWKTKVLPLLATSITLSVIFIPEFLTILLNTFKVILDKNMIFKKYDTVKASYCAVTIFMSVLTISIIVMSIKFHSKKKALNPD
jgi:hypothetical protein